MAIAIGTPAPDVAGLADVAARILVFFKVTCSTTQLATPAIERLAQAYPDRVVGIGQDPPEALEGFGRAYGLTLLQIPDLDPYPASDAYGIESAPTAVAVDAAGDVVAVAESWDRDAWNDLSDAFADAMGVARVVVSEPDDGLPAFKPGWTTRNVRSV